MKLTILLLNMRRRVYFLKKLKEELSNTPHKIIYVDSNNLDPMKNYADEFIVLNDKDANFVTNLFDLCVKKDVNLVIPWLDSDINLLSSNNYLFQAGNISLAIPDSEFIEISNDKFITYDWLSQKNIPTPLSFKLSKDNHEYFSLKKTNTYNFPLIAKPRFGQGSRNVIKLNNASEYENFANKISDDYLVQNFLPGKELTIDVCWYRNQIYFCVPRLRLKVRGGESMISKVVKTKSIEILSKKICSFFDEPLLFNFQVIYDELNNPKVIEINPRFGGGSDLSIHSGANIPRAILKIYLNLGCLHKDKIENNIIMSRYFHSEFFKS
ncbi:ATP-grasp domain-containing protein [Kalamiella sp. sgz302252]|uniref:ATP-grasp domain-containing protein n=1 Tax=Pantoea sp. sgz302252 TaxID=3341827 RepID=UPI0036D20DC3